MKMKYLYIDQKAVQTLIGDRLFQSSEYANAQTLLAFILEERIPRIVGLTMTIESDCGFIFQQGESSLSHAVLFDFSLFKGFTNHSPGDIITILQKILRFANRHWSGASQNVNEKKLDDGHALVFPFSNRSYRVLLNLSFNQKFQDRKSVNYIVVSGDGSSDHLRDDKIDISFKNIRETAQNLYATNLRSVDPKSVTNFSIMRVSSLERASGELINPYQGFDNWMHFLTESQRTFITRDITGIERLEGAAGTGKTLTLILRVIYILKKKKESNTTCNILFIAHSHPSKLQIIERLRSNFPDYDSYTDRLHSIVSVEVSTLQEWCLSKLGGEINSTELIDEDPQASKDMQMLLMEETMDECLEKDFPAFKVFCSSEFVEYLQKCDKHTLLQQIQSEIAITIKGRAREDMKTYIGLKRLEGSLPLKEEGDFEFLMCIFRKYQEKLDAGGAFDSDDIVLTAYSQLDTPLWRRRRKLEGYDVIFIDETHLFNHNELSIFHFLTKTTPSHLIFAIDKSQAFGDHGFSDDAIDDSVVRPEDRTSYHTIFRSSPQIVNVAFSILSSGSTLFTTMENPLDHINYSFTEEEERKTVFPKYTLLPNDKAQIQQAFKLAEGYCSSRSVKRHNVLFACTSPLLLNEFKQYTKSANKPFEFLAQRADIDRVIIATQKNCFIAGLIDHVGGLEFDAVILLGVDKGRVPPLNVGEDGYIFQSYAWHNRMYVAVTRAKYYLTILGDSSRGPSDILKNAIADGLIEYEG